MTFCTVCVDMFVAFCYNIAYLKRRVMNQEVDIYYKKLTLEILLAMCSGRYSSQFAAQVGVAAAIRNEAAKDCE